ncbi:hypothetical protein N8683_02845 [bacterium]|nr:hypothetical protein [bacterium]
MKTISNVFKDPLDQPAQINGMVSPGQANDFICPEQLRSFDALVGIEKDDLETLINFCEERWARKFGHSAARLS